MITLSFLYGNKRETVQLRDRNDVLDLLDKLHNLRKDNMLSAYGLCMEEAALLALENC